jgi:hypothetical protein
VDEVPDHFVRGEVVEQPEQAFEQQTVLATAKLLGHNDAGMGLPSRLPLLVERGEIAGIAGCFPNQCSK